jgi:hypothetical protein
MAKRLLVTVSIFSIVIAAACGKSSKSSSSSSGSSSTTAKAGADSSKSSASGSTPDCTALITVAEASNLFGKPSSAPEAGLNTTGSEESFCDWNLADKNDFSGFTLLQLQAFNSTRFVPKSSYDAAKVVDVSIPGASEAFAIKDQATMTQINFATKGRRVVISFSPADKNGAAHVNDIVALATTAASRIS